MRFNRIFFICATLILALRTMPATAEQPAGSGVAAAAEPAPPSPPPETEPWKCEIDPGSFQTRGAWATNLWPGGVVPFEFHANVSAANQQVAINAMNEWAGAATINFRPAFPADPARVRFESGTDCPPGTVCGSSPVGFANGIRTIRIGRCPSSGACDGTLTWSYAITLHEIGHALGLWHEHQRPDRANYVAVLQQNYGGTQFEQDFGIPSGARGFSGFDFDSIMAYRACTFSRCGSCSCADPNCVMIQVLQPNQARQCSMGSASQLSSQNRRLIAAMYPPPGTVFVSTSQPGNPATGTFVSPFPTIGSGVSAAPNGGVLWVDSGTYAGAGIYTRPMTFRSLDGPVIIRN
ncbi:MAG: hypothetical protein JSR77_04215 [Planctomycetes bacterium]|nr:hypothetical protein [Planctomycetota bacterium]